MSAWPGISSRILYLVDETEGLLLKNGCATRPTSHLNTPSKEIPPREWAERLYNIQRWTSMEQGGHLAPIEELVAVARDIAVFFASLI